jgi:PEP-CTERM motif
VNVFSKWVAQVALVCSALLVSVGVSAQVTWTVAAGKVTGAQNVFVQGSFYDVVFSDVYVAPQSFITGGFAEAAAQALVDQVFVPGAPLNLDAQPNVLAGCAVATHCVVKTFYQGQGNYVYAADATNNQVEADDSVASWGGMFQSVGDVSFILSYDSRTSASWALVSAVPEPETYALMLAGLGLVGTVARRRKAKQA